jgi:lipoyl(octanoyl) transferase
MSLLHAIAPGGREILVRDLGRVPYAEALAEQRAVQAAVIAGTGPMTVLLLEHDPPVITISRRRGAREHLLASPEALAEAGITVAETDRGGDITYHGPGQLVAYPILDLNHFGLRLHGWMRRLEETVIATVATWGLVADRDPSATGVWVRPGAPGGGAKLCAMGVRVSRWVTMHGLALNVRPRLEHFGFIVPCGLAGREVTSLERELGEACPSMADVKAVFVRELERGLAVEAAGGPDAYGAA